MLFIQMVQLVFCTNTNSFQNAVVNFSLAFLFELIVQKMLPYHRFSFNCIRLHILLTLLRCRWFRTSARSELNDFMFKNIYLIIKIFYSLLCQHSFSGSMGLRHYCASQECQKPIQSIMTSQSPFKQEFDIYKPQIRIVYSSNVKYKQLSVAKTINLL